jgi:uncharacterized protein YqeY
LSALKQKIADDMHQAMKNREAARLSTLKMLLSAIGYAEMDKQRELTDDEVKAVLSKEVKQHRESIAAYKQGGRADLVEKEEGELKILLEYMPPQMSAEEIEAIVKAAIEAVGATGPSDKGKVMGKVMPQTRGKADGQEVNSIVDRMLSA